MMVETMPKVSPRDRVPGPVRRFEVLEDDPGVAILVGCVAPDVEVTRRRSLWRPPGPLEPRVLVRRMVANQFRYHLQAPPVRFSDEGTHVAHVPVRGMDSVVVGNVVPIVELGRGIEGQQPDRSYAKALEVIELLDQASEITDPVAVAIEESPNVDFVDDGIFEPERVERRGFRQSIRTRAHLAGAV